MRSLAWLLPVLLSGCALFGSNDGEPPSPLVSFKASAAVDSVWSVDTGRGPGELFLKLAVAQHQHVLYLCDTRGRVTAVNQKNGDRLWRVNLSVPLSAGVGFGDDLVLVATRKGEVIALKKDNGAERWRARVGSEVLAPPVAEAGVVVVQSVDGQLTGFSSETGKRLWNVERTEPALSLRGTATPVIVQGVVLTGLATGKLMAVALRDGRVVWEIPIAQAQGRTEIERLVDVDAAPLVVGRTLFSAAYQGKVVAVSLEQGRLLWSRELSTFSSLAADDKNLYLSDGRGHAYALDQASGATVWKQERLSGRQPSAPAVVGAAIAVGDYKGYLHWLAREDGQFMARERIGRSAILTPPLVDGDMVYVMTQNGYLDAVRFGTLSP